MTDRTSFETVADGDVLKEGYFNGCYDTVTDTSTGHSHDGTDSLGIGRWVKIDSGAVPTGSQYVTLADSISSDYTHFRLVLIGITASTSNRDCILRFNSDSTTAHYPARVTTNSGAAITASSNAASGLEIGNTNSYHGIIEISNYNGQVKPFNCQGMRVSSNSYHIIGYFTDTDQITKIELGNNAPEDDITGGYFELYGFIDY